jgi:hypothetical protein
MRKSPHESGEELARLALAQPYMFSEGRRLDDARRTYERAKAELVAAEAAWQKRIAPAKGWAPDPLAQRKGGER